MDSDSALILASLVGAVVSGSIAAYAKYAARNRKLNIIATVFAVIFTVVLMVAAILFME